MTLLELETYLKGKLEPVKPYAPDLTGKRVIGTNNWQRHIRQREELSRAKIGYDWAERNGIYYLIVKK